MIILLYIATCVAIKSDCSGYCSVGGSSNRPDADNEGGDNRRSNPLNDTLNRCNKSLLFIIKLSITSIVCMTSLVSMLDSYISSSLSMVSSCIDNRDIYNCCLQNILIHRRIFVIIKR